MTPSGKPVRVRIAPSPTGDPHVGTAYIALFNYVFARQQGRKFVLRIEDTDLSRARTDSEQLIFDALHWIGLTWDEGHDVGRPTARYRHSDSDDVYRDHASLQLDHHLMAISHVIRAEEWISSTQKHVLLYRAFGWDAPQFIHMPLLRNADKDKTKISKRKQPVSVNYYRDIGILPEALLNFLGTMGWSFGGDREKFTLQDMIDVFSWDRISPGGPVVNPERLILRHPDD